MTRLLMFWGGVAAGNFIWQLLSGRHDYIKAAEISYFQLFALAWYQWWHQ